jgi:dipeptidyl-peptidase-4
VTGATDAPHWNIFGMAEVDSTLEITKYLQTSLPYVDKDRTAIWGWSYGGYLSLSTLISDKQNIFQCGASVAPVTDWTLYDTYYTERYMGLLDDNINGYNRARVFHKLNNLSKYNKKYFVAHGTHDDNVHFQQSMLLSAALEEKDILFRQHAYPDQDHGIGMYHQHLYHTLTDFFKNDCFRDITKR